VGLIWSEAMARKHAHYFRNVAHLSEVDVYRVLELFNVTDQALGHAIKKLLAPGGRGAGKDFRRDVQEAVDTLQRRLEMLDEDAAKDGWTAWNGGCAPITAETLVQIRLRNGRLHQDRANLLDWTHDDSGRDIVAYRVVE
jgi:hypothetical protein